MSQPRRTTDWRVLAALFLFTGLAESLGFGHFQAFTPLYLHQLGVPANAITAWTGVLGIIGSVIGLPLLPLWGALAERYGRKPIIVVDRFHEVDLIVRTARDLGVRPHIGVRARLTTKGAGKWVESTGDRSKFGLTAVEIVDAVERLRAEVWPII